MADLAKTLREDFSRIKKKRKTLFEQITDGCIADELKIGVDNMTQRLPTVKVIWLPDPPFYTGKSQNEINYKCMIVCAYCDTRNEVSLSKCDSCGGSLSIENIEKGEE